MYYIGIDIAKKFNYLGIFNETNVLMTTHLKFDNSKTGFKRVSEYLKSNKIKTTNCIIFMEATGHYHLNLFHYLHDKGFKVSVINPALTRSVSYAVAKGNKNDKVDCLKIVTAAQIYNSEPSLPVLEAYNELRKLTRERNFLVKQQSGYKRNLIGLLDQSFPEYLGEMFPDLNNNTAFHLLEHYQTASDFARANLNKLTEYLIKYSKGKYRLDKAKELKELAKGSIAKKANTKYDSSIISAIVFSLKTVREQIKLLEDLICESAVVKESTLSTIPGFGPLTTATILAETGDISRFKSADNYISYAGLGILDNESGNKYKRKRISKNGNENIRNAVYIAAQVCATTHLDPYFDAKLAEYKQRMSHKEAVVVLSRKMLRVAFSLMKNNSEFVSPNL